MIKIKKKEKTNKQKIFFITIFIHSSMKLMLIVSLNIQL
jgi:hypothetical protein